MVFRRAQGVRAARVVGQTRYFANMVFANLVVGTVFVFVALDPVTSDVRVSVVAGLAIANRPVVDGRTLRVSAADHFFAHLVTLGLKYRTTTMGSNTS